jgi:hypothetical protein
MTQPIGGYRPQAYQPFENAQQDALSYCRTADTVTAGYLCDEPTVVSNACRSPKNAVDAFVCDDKQMASVQHEIWDTVKSLVMTAIGAIAGRP